MLTTQRTPAIVVATLLAAATLSPAAVAAPISTVGLPDNFGGPVTCLGAGNDAASLGLNAADCSAAGGLVMTPFGDDPNAPGTSVTSVASPLGGTLHFLEKNGTDPVADALPMIVGDPSVIVGDPNWWQYDNHSSAYMTPVNWIELHFDTTGADAVRAFSFFVGASFSGRGWVQSFDADGNDSFEPFNVSPGNSPGFGVFTDPGSCSAITRIIVEPDKLWGVGNLAINQDPCGAKVPEPGSLGLLALGMLILGTTRRRRTA